MKLLELVLEAFGPFTDVTLDFSGGSEGFHLIYGNNEAGKSSALAALESLFFSMEKPDRFTFVHSQKQQLRIGATLQRSDGSLWQVVRRHGKKNSLLDAEGHPLPPESFTDFFGSMDRHMFRRQLCLDHETLREGGEQLRLLKGETGKALLSAALSGKGIHDILAELDAEADRHFRPRGQKQLVNQSVAEFKKIKTEEKKRRVSAHQWKKLHKQLERLSKQRKDLDQRLSERSREKERLARIEQSIPTVARWQRAKEKLAEQGALPALPEEFSRELPLLFQKRSVTAANLKRNEDRIDEVRKSMESMDIPLEYFDEETRIAHLSRQIGVYLKASDDREKLRAKADLLKQDIERRHNKLFPNLSESENGSISLTSVQRKQLRSLGQRIENLSEREKLATQSIEKLESKSTRLKGKLAEIGEIRETRELENILKETRKKGDLDAEIGKLSRELEQETKQVLQEARRLGIPAKTLENILDCPVPSGDRIKHYNDEYDQLSLAIKQNLDEATKQRSTLENLEKEIDALCLEREVPSESMLEELRQERDIVWDKFMELLRISTKSDISVQELHEWSERFEPLMRQADDLADRLRREAERVAQVARLQAEKAMTEKALQRLEIQRETLNKQRVDFLRNWEKLWEPSGIDPSTPPDRVLWIAQYRELVRETQETTKKQQQLQQLLESRAQAIVSLQVHLEKIEKTSENNDERLEFWLLSGDSAVSRSKSQRQQQERLQEDLDALQEEWDDATRQHETVDKDLKKLWKTWRKEMALIDPEGKIEVEQGLSMIGDLEELETQTEKLDDLKRRIHHIEEDEKDIQATVTEVCGSLAPELLSVPLEQAVDRLAATLKRAGEDRERLVALQKRERELLGDREKDNEELVEVQAKIDNYCHLASCEENRLLEIDEKLRAYKEATESVNRCEEQLLSLGWQTSLDNVIEEIRQNDLDTCRISISEISNDIEEMEKERNELLVQLGDDGRRLKIMEEDSGATDLSMEGEAVLASVRRYSENYLRYKLARTILERGIERFRKQNQSPILKRAGELLKTFTCGSFEDVRSEYYSTDEPELIGVRNSGEKVSVEGMSQGTRDQLYLALRLAHLEDSMDGREVLPLIVDDIMINFDDERASATLKELGRLSDRTQILFFTHHRRLVDIAEKFIDSERLFLSTLN